MISEEVISAIQWIFSGIGGVVLTLAIGFFYKKRKKSKSGKQEGNPPQTSNSQKLSIGKANKSSISQIIKN
jgi:LPXTG-motif cell wall-anchored protein